MQYPIEGYRVVDFGWVLAGPVTGHILADMGAEVIKVESRRRLDASRRGRPITGERTEMGDRGEEPDLIPLFHNINRNKLSITVDITHPKGPPLLKELIKRSDAVLENFPPAVMRRYGLHYEALREVKPDIVMISLSTAGQSGPLADLRAYAPAVTSLGGLEALVGYPGERILGMMGLNFSDPTAGLISAFALLVGLYYRQRTGKGQYIDLSQMEAIACLAGEAIMDYTMNGRVMRPRGNHHPSMAPHGNYPCQGDDKWVSIAVGSEEEWQAFRRALGDPPWAQDERFADAYRRLNNREALDKFVAAWTREHSPYEVTDILQKAGVAAMPVMGIEEQFSDPHYQARGVYVDVEHPIIGAEIIYGLPWKLSDTPGAIRGPAPNLGQHNDYVFREILGLSSEEIARLTEEGVIA